MARKQKSQKGCLTGMLIILFFPIGLFLMWKNKNYSKKTRVIITSIFALIIVNGIINPVEENITTDSPITITDTVKNEPDESNNDIIKESNNTDNDVDSKDSVDSSKSYEQQEIKSETIIIPVPIITTPSEKDAVPVEPSTAPTSTPTPTETKVTSKDTYEFDNKTYKIIEVDGGNKSGYRESNVAVDIGFGSREYWALTNEYGQLVTVIADEITLQDDSTESVTSSGRYYSDEAKVPGTERDDLDEGHVIADSLGGVSNAYNITPQESTLNRHGDQAYMERVMRDAGGASDFIATITYPNNETQIPSRYKYEYVLRGEKIVDEFDNINPDKANEVLHETSKPSTTNQNSSVNSGNKNDLSSVDANGNGKVTIKEAKDAGYKMPINSEHWLYKYMDDRDGDGMVGD